MRQNIFLAINLLVIMGCASNKIEEQKHSGKTQTVSSQPKSENAKPQSNHISKAASVGADSKSSDLVEAIKSENEEKISRASSEVLLKDPHNIAALNALGVLHLKKKQYLAAQYFFNSALQTNNSSEIHNNLGLVHQGLGENFEALKQFKKAIELNGKNASAAVNAGSIYLSNRDYKNAFLAFEIAYSVKKNDSEIANNFAVSAVGVGKLETAEKIYKELYSNNPGDRSVLLNYAIFMIDHKKQYNEGMDLINRLKFLGLSSDMQSEINRLEKKAKVGLN